MHWREILSVLQAEPKANVLLHGPPGVGKTHLANSVLSAGDRAAFNVTLTADTAVAELVGMFVPRGKAGFAWQDGPALLAWSAPGSGLVLNEIDQAPPGVAFVLHAILDDPEVAALTIPDGRTVRPAPDFRAMATMNGAPKSLPAGLRDRFSLVLRVDEPHPDALSGLQPDERAFLLRCYSDPALTITYREFMQYRRLRNSLSDELAAAAVWDDRAEDVLTARQLGLREHVPWRIPSRKR